jgi:hypothetical protein
MNTIGSDTNVSWHLFMQTGAPPTQAQADSAANAAHTAWVTNLAPLTSTNFSLTQVTVTDLSDPSGPVGINSTAAPGTRAGSAGLSAPVSMLVNMKIQRRYRGGKPRIYVPAGLSADMATPQTWGATFLTQFHDGWLAFSSAIGSSLSWASGGAQTVNVAYFKGHKWVGDDETGHKKVPLPYPGGPHVDPILAWAFNPLIGTQRRRVRPG